MAIFDRQFELLKEQYQGASEKQLPSGARLIEIPNVPLKHGWNRTHVNVFFLAPVGYPGAQPDCFWTDQPCLRVADRPDPPQNSNDQNPIPEEGMRGTWFSWHLQQWNPNRDSLLTYMNVIQQRLDLVR